VRLEHSHVRGMLLLGPSQRLSKVLCRYSCLFPEGTVASERGIGRGEGWYLQVDSSE
jgi:hypothetical protein